MTSLEEFIVYADGSCINNGSPDARGGWAFVVLEKCHKKIWSEGSGEESPATNNRAELRAVIEALRVFTTRVRVNVHTDSQYVINGFEKGWIDKWLSNDFKNSSGAEVKNKDLWLELNRLVRLHKISWTWVKGHSGIEFNEYVDKLAFGQSTKNRVEQKQTSPSRRKRVLKTQRKALIRENSEK